MADTVRRLKARTHRQSLSGETSASDDETLNVHSQTVSNITMDFFYKPKTISLLIFAVAIVVFMAFTRYIDFKLDRMIIIIAYYTIHIHVICKFTLGSMSEKAY